MRTIALRLTGTKSAKEELKELGEETENVITTQSKLRDVIKEATAVASNEYKGFDILDDNGNYKSTYEIMLGIAEVYDEILETDKKFGRNNANLLLENVAGKTRANIAASIFQNPQLLKDAYKSSQEAQDSAMEENEKYLNSISGHMAQLQNAYQEVWANSMNRDTINFFIDLGKNILNVVDDVGLLGTAFTTIVGTRSIVGFQNNKGFAVIIAKWVKDSLKSLATMEGAIGSVTTSAIGLGKSFTSSFASAIPVIGGVATAIGLVGVAVYGVIRHYEKLKQEAINTATDMGKEWQQQKQSLSEYASQYEELKTKLDFGNLSEEETLETKQQIYDIQKSITEEYGAGAGEIDLINGKLQEQLDILTNISQTKANEIWQSEDYQEGFRIAQDKIMNPKELKVYANNEKIQGILDKYLTKGVNKNVNGYGTEVGYYGTSGDAYKQKEQLLDAIKEIEELQKNTPEEEVGKYFNGVLIQMRRHLDSINNIITENEAILLSGLEIQLNRNSSSQGGSILNNYKQSVTNLESAYTLGNTKKINEARKTFEEANRAKENFLSIEGNNQFTFLFDQIDTSLINTQNRITDTIKLIRDIPTVQEKEGLFDEATPKIYKKNSKELSKLAKNEQKAYKAAEKLYALKPDKIDIKATLDNNTYASGKYADALNDLMNAMGWTSSNADSLIDALITAGIVQGDASDATNRASDSYSTFSSSVNSAIESLTTLNSALDESAKGTGLTEQTVQQLRNAFGDDLNSVLEKTANGYHLNVEGAYLLREQQTALIKSNYASALSEQYTALNKVKQGYLEAVAAGQDTTGFVQQRDAIQKNIDKLNESLMAYQNANSAYQTWLASQNSEGEREMYNSIYSGYDAVKDELERGFAGEKTRSWIDLIFNDEGEDWDAWTAPAEKINEMFKQVKKKIEGTGGFSIADFFTVDENGKSTSQGIWNFFKAIENKQDEVGQKFVDLENKKFNFNAFDIADLLGMDVEAVQSIVRAAFDAGFEIHMEQPLLTLDQLKEKADSAKKSLETIEGKKIAIDLDPTTIEEADKAMDVLTEYQQELLENDTIPFDVKTQKLEDTASLMDYIAAKKRSIFEEKLFEPEIQNTKLQKSAETISNLYKEIRKSTIESGAFNANQLEFFKIDPNAINDVDYLTGLFDRIRHFQAEPELNQTQFLMFEELLKEIQARIDLLNNTDSSGGSLTVDQFMAADKIVGDINTKLDYANQHSHMTFDWDSDEQFIEDLNTLANLPKNAKIELNIPTDASGEELLELAKKGELHIGVKVDGQIPQQPTDAYQTLHTQEEVTLGVTTVGTDAAQQIIQQFEEKNGTEYNIKLKTDAQEAETSIQEILDGSNEIDNSTPEATATLDDKATSPLIALGNKLDDLNGDSATVFSYYQDPNNAHGELAYIDSHVYDRKQTITTEYKTIGSPSGMGGVNGSAHAFGTAFARGSILSGNAYAKGGNWGVPKDQTALVNEVGEEIIVRDGQWFVANGGNAGFTQLRKGDVVFNSEQSKELLEKGYITGKKRASIVGFANGSAFIGGTAYDYGTWDGALKPSKPSKGMGGSTTSKGSSNKGGNGNHGGGNSSKAKEEAKETKNTLDEVEILIARIERQISRLDNTIGNTYIKWATRNQAITRDLTKVSEEIKDQKKAYNTYMDKANSIGLPKEWVTIIQNGQQAIEDVVEKAKENGDTSDTLWDKITKYREYYEKALAALDKVQELEQKEGELYKTKFDNEQTYYEEMIDNLQHTVDIMGAYNDQLEESGKLNSRNLIIKQMSVERAKLQKLEDEYTILVNRQNEAVKSGKIKKYSEAWYEMQQTINEVRDAIVEANTNLISFDNAFREVNWNRWDKIHDAISGVTNELEFLYDLIDEDKMFDDTGTITNEGLAAFGLLAQEYDTYFAEVERYQKEIDVTKKELADDPYNQNLVDKLKEQIEAQQDAVNGAKKTKEAMLDVAENGVKKQIDYIKKLIDDYEELMEAQKDQSDYAKKVADQQKEINKLEKQYRAIQNDTSEEGATKRQQLREQLKEKRQDLADTQEDRRISETKDMLAKFQETFEDFLENKLKDVEGIIKEGITGVNNNTEIIKDTIESVADSYGYTLSDTLQTTLSGLSNNLASYFDSAFDNRNVKSIADGVDAIVNYYNKAQIESNRIAMADKVKETGTHIQAYVDEKGETHVGYFDNNGNQKTDYTGQARSGDKIYRFENGQKVTQGNRWVNEGGNKYYLNKNGTYATGITSINGKKYYFDSTGKMKTAWQTINGNKYHFNKQGVMHTGLVTIGKNKYYFDKNGVLQMGKWQEINGKRYYLSATDGHVLTGKKEINGEKWTFYNDGVLKQKGWKKGTSSVPKSGYAWTNEGFKAEAIIRKSDGAILTPLNRGDSVIPSNAMKNMYQALTNPEKYLKQYTTPDVRVVQANNGKGDSTPATINMQFIANGVQDANKFANDLMNNKKLESWIQEITLGRANGNNSFKKYSYAIR